jgi:glutathione synthase
MNIAVLMDPIERLNQKKDTTLALIERALDFGHTVHVFYPTSWFWKQGILWAQLYEIAYKQACFKVKPLRSLKALDAYEIILMRQDPPVDQHYIYTSYALDTLIQKGVVVSNLPASVRDWNEKFALTQFPEWIVPTLITQQIYELKKFRDEQETIVLKPLHAFGGESVFLVHPHDPNFSVIIEKLTQRGTMPIMAQRYIPDIKHRGDKRILMVHGQAVPYALARMPADSDWRGNLAAGARGVVVPLTGRDQAIAQALGPILVNKGLHFVGLDVIGDYLTEINVTSPTCLREISRETGMDIAKDYWSGLSALVKS